MATAPRPQLSSVFDDLLAQSKKRFDALYGGPPARAPEASAAPMPPLRAEALPRPAAAATLSAAPPAGDSRAARQLNERFGGDWRHEIVERRREGDEAIAVCRLVFGKSAATRTQSGRARMPRTSIAGASGGAAFKLGVVEIADERQAFRRAAEAALQNCIDAI
jgi:hypothetical protein